jgi:hypothetical protein
MNRSKAMFSVLLISSLAAPSLTVAAANRPQQDVVSVARSNELTLSQKAELQALQNLILLEAFNPNGDLSLPKAKLRHPKLEEASRAIYDAAIFLGESAINSGVMLGSMSVGITLVSSVGDAVAESAGPSFAVLGASAASGAVSSATAWTLHKAASHGAMMNGGDAADVATRMGLLAGNVFGLSASQVNQVRPLIIKALLNNEDKSVTKILLEQKMITRNQAAGLENAFIASKRVTRKSKAALTLAEAADLLEDTAGLVRSYIVVLEETRGWNVQAVAEQKVKLNRALLASELLIGRAQLKLKR